MRPTADMYQVLSGVYDIDWAYFSLQYVDVVHSLLGSTPGRVLDLACGTGILAVELARRGHRVWGIDRSERMIGLAREKARGLPNLTFTVGDMTSFSPDSTVDLVSCTFDSINYLLTPGQVSAMLERVRAVLAGGGVFLFDSVTERFFRQYNHASHTRFLQGERVTQRLTYHRKKREAVTVFRFGVRAVERHLQRPWDFHELEPLLRRHGFR
ncbi:MAG: class I SAM-dependent methyltransferase, partial [Spirochaetota bacterium]